MRVCKGFSILGMNKYPPAPRGGGADSDGVSGGGGQDGGVGGSGDSDGGAVWLLGSGGGGGGSCGGDGVRFGDSSDYKGSDSLLRLMD